MQVINQPQLPFISEKKEEQQFPPKKETRKAKKEWLEKTSQEEITEPVEEAQPLERNYDYIETEGRKILIWLEERLDEAREFIQFVRSPTMSNNTYKNNAIESEIKEFVEKGVYVLSAEIIHYIETLIFYAKYNEDMFGSQNYMLNDIVVEIFGIDQIKTKLQQCQENKADANEVLFWFSRLVNCAARPLSVHEELVKQKIYTPNIGDGGLVNSQERG